MSATPQKVSKVQADINRTAAAHQKNLVSATGLTEVLMRMYKARRNIDTLQRLVSGSNDDNNALVGRTQELAAVLRKLETLLPQQRQPLPGADDIANAAQSAVIRTDGPKSGMLAEIRRQLLELKRSSGGDTAEEVEEAKEEEAPQQSKKTARRHADLVGPVASNNKDLALGRLEYMLESMDNTIHVTMPDTELEKPEAAAAADTESATLEELVENMYVWSKPRTGLV